MEATRQLHSTSWLAKKLGLSISTIERLRTYDSGDLPPFIKIGRSYRYDNRVVDAWLDARQRIT